MPCLQGVDDILAKQPMEEIPLQQKQLIARLFKNFIWTEPAVSITTLTELRHLTLVFLKTAKRNYNCQNHSKQDKQCTYNVILRRVRATIVVLEKQNV
jgi:hypothetical protein